MATGDKNPQGFHDPLSELLNDKGLTDELSKVIEGKDCPGENELLAYVLKKVDEPERIEIRSHLLFCSRCKQQVNELERRAPKILEEANKGRHSSGSPGTQERPRLIKKALLAAAASALIGAFGYFLWTQATTNLSYGFKVVNAQGSSDLRIGQQLFYEISAPEPVFLIEISIDGDRNINSRIPPGPRNGQFSNGDRILFTPEVPGTFDLYLALCPVSQGFPNRILNGLLKFIKTETSISRDNKRQGVEMALSLYQLQFIHEVFEIHH